MAKNFTLPEPRAFLHLWTNPWTAWVGFRYLRSKKSSRFLSLITLLSMFGIGIGVCATIVVLSVMDGFEEELKKRLMSSDTHIVITPTREVQGFDVGFVPESALLGTAAAKAISDDREILNMWPMISTEAILRFNKKVTGVALKGIGDMSFERLKPQIIETAQSQMLVQREGAQSTRLPGIFVGKELAYSVGLIPGDLVTLISPTETQGPLESVPRLRQFVIEGIYQSGTPEQELHTIYAREKDARSFLRKRDVVSQWEISVHDFDRAPDIAARLRPLLPGFKVRDWVQMNSTLFFSLKLERLAMFVVMVFIVIVASFNIITTLTMMVMEKKREISILKAMGARDAQVGAVFLAEGLLIGGIGVGGGALLALAICSVLKRFEFVALPDVYYDRTLPVTFVLEYYLVVVLAAFIIVLLASAYPTRRAVRLHPLEGIRSK